MTSDVLKTAIENTKAKIYQLKQHIEESTDPTEKRLLKRQLKQHIQLWQIDQLG